MDLPHGHVVIVPFPVWGYERDGETAYLPAQEAEHLLRFHGWRPEDLEADDRRAERWVDRCRRHLIEEAVEAHPTSRDAHHNEHASGMELPVPHVHVDDHNLDALARLAGAMKHLTGDVAPHPFDDAYAVLEEVTDTLAGARSEGGLVVPWDEEGRGDDEDT